jgi:hypothetical protein
MATMVMAFGIATSITAMNYGFRALDTARNTTIAGQLLESAMEDLRLLPWSSGNQSSLSSIQGNATVSTSNISSDPAVAAVVSRFTVTRNIYPYPVGTALASATLMQIDLTATWKGIDGRQHTLTYTSYYGKNGLHDYYVN